VRRASSLDGRPGAAVISGIAWIVIAGFAMITNGLRMPWVLFWALLAAWGVVEVWRGRRGLRSLDWARSGRCPRCGYDLRGTTRETCPECGADRS